MSSGFFPTFLAALIKKFTGKPFVYNLQDIFPDSLISIGLAKQGGLLWKVGRKIEDVRGIAFGPDTRMIPKAPPWAVAMAQMVSSFIVFSILLIVKW